MTASFLEPILGHDVCAGDPRLAQRDDLETRRAAEAFMREQIHQHAWLIDAEVASLRTWWPQPSLCTAFAEVTWTGPPGRTWLLAQVDMHALLGSTHAADQLAAFQVLTVDEEHVPVLLEAAVQIETAEAHGPPQRTQQPHPS